MTGRVGRRVRRALFALAVFAALLAAIRLEVPKNFNDFDQSFYLTIAHDLVHHGVFSNGVFDDVDSTRARPLPGMFLGPGYPALVVAVMAASPRFAAAVDCAVAANHGHRPLATCPVDNRPMHVVHALLLALGVLAMARAAELLVRTPAFSLPGTGRVAAPAARPGAVDSGEPPHPARTFGPRHPPREAGRDGDTAPPAFYLAGAVATAALAAEAWLFSYLMTESLQVGLYGLFALALVRALMRGGALDHAAAGLALGLLVLAKPSWLALAPVVVVLALAVRRPALPRALAAFALALAVVVGPWVARNALVVGKAGLTEEYGSAALIERFAFNTMRPGEALTALPYCLPVFGPKLTGPTRFDWNQPGSFFEAGRARRDELTKQHGRLDPIFRNVLRDEMAAGGWLRHLAVSVPLAWCGLFVGQALGLVLVPLLAIALVLALRRRHGLFVAYALPPLAMVALHALLANHYPRYNLALIAPMAAAAAWLIAAACRRARRSAPPPPAPSGGRAG